LFGVLAPLHDALMLHATSLIGHDGAHVFTGPIALASLTASGGPVLTDSLVLIWRNECGWLAASTPFAWPKGSRRPRTSRNAAASESLTARASTSAFPKRSPRPPPPESSQDRPRADPKAFSPGR